MIVLFVVMMIFGLLLVGGYGYQLLRLHRMRKLSDVTGTARIADQAPTWRQAGFPLFWPMITCAVSSAGGLA
jgi:hypothetical protein